MKELRIQKKAKRKAPREYILFLPLGGLNRGYPQLRKMTKNPANLGNNK